MRRTWKRLGALLLACVMAASLLPVTALATGEPVDLVTSTCPVTASSEGTIGDFNNPDQGRKELAVDGNTTDTQWSSANMKTGGATADPNAEQTHQWLQVDLGEGTYPKAIESIKLYFNAKVWPMVYKVQTSATGGTGATDWTDLYTVTRSPFAGTVKNGAGQNIADEANNVDVVTKTSVPALAAGAAVQRYVRFYVEKVNTSAPGNNVCLREIEVCSREAEPARPDVAAAIGGITADNLTLQDGRYVGQNAPQGTTLAVRGSELDCVVADDGTVTDYNLNERSVRLLARLSETAHSENYAEKNLTVTIPAHTAGYPAGWVPTGTNPKPEVIPTLQEWAGGSGSFTLDETSRVVVNDTHNLGLSRAADELIADLREITGLTLEKATGAESAVAAHDIYIGSLPAGSYDLGDEGYILRSTQEGLRIYAPTYIGAVHGTVTAEQILWLSEDHLSVPCGMTRDYPAYPVRGLKLDIGRAPFRYQLLEDYAKIMRWYKMSEYDLHINDNENVTTSDRTATDQTHKGFHRLESDSFPHLAGMPGVKTAGVDPDLVDEDYYNDPEGFGGNPTYTKQQWRDLTQLSQDYGMYLLTEIDMPGHALGYNQYVEQYPEEAAAAGVAGPVRSTDTSSDYRAMELLALTGNNAQNALDFATKLWDEYTSDGTITGDVVHIGADEYWVHDAAHNNAFATFADTLRETVQENLGADTKIRMWGASLESFSTATTALNKTHAELAQHYQLDVWATNYENPVQRSREGYQLVNCEQTAMYCCPGRYQRDTVNAEYVFNSWDPTMFGSSRLLYGDPNLLGAKTVMWGEQTQEGLTELDVHQRVLRAIAVVSEKTWGGTEEADTFTDYELRFQKLAEGPGTRIAMTVPSETSLVLDYDFRNVSEDGGTVYDASGNGYDGAVTGAAAEDGWLSFDGSALVTTPLRTLSYPYTVTFDMKVDAGNTPESSLLSGYDGRVQVTGHNGHMSANNSSFIRDLGYTAPTDGTSVQVAIVGTHQAVRLYVNGQLQAFLSQTGNAMQDGTRPVSSSNAQVITGYFGSVPLPLEEIGKGFHGSLANLKVYNKALTAAELTSDDGLVNVAQDALAASSSYHAGDAYDMLGEQRTALAFKAVDGEEQEMYSYWKADHNDSALTLDLGETRQLSRVDLTFLSGGASSSFTLQTSSDGANWTNFGAAVTGNTSLTPTVSAASPVAARYLRFNERGGSCKLAELRAYEAVDKTALTAKVDEVADYAREQGLSFAADDAQGAFGALTLARAVAGSPLATQADVTRALAELNALDLSGTVPEADTQAPTTPQVTVSNVGETTATVRWSASDNVGVDHYVFTMGGETLTLTETSRSLTGLTPGTRYTVSVQAYDAAGNASQAGSASFTTTNTAGGGSDVGGGGGLPVARPEPSGNEPSDATVIDPSTGTTTRTVKRADGSTVVTQTVMFGDKTITVTDPEGQVVVRAELPAVIPTPQETFLDVPAGHWAEQAIRDVQSLGMVQGVGGGRYDMTSPVTRASVAAILYRFSHGVEGLESSFSDVAEDAWYADAIAWAARTGVVTGRGDGTFAPDAPVTREQFALMLTRYAQLIGLDTAAESTLLAPYLDGPTVSTWASGAVAWCAKTGLLQGKDNSLLDPAAGTSRAEAAVMLSRFVDLLSR